MCVECVIMKADTFSHFKLHLYYRLNSESLCPLPLNCGCSMKYHVFPSVLLFSGWQDQSKIFSLVWIRNVIFVRITVQIWPPVPALQWLIPCLSWVPSSPAVFIKKIIQWVRKDYHPNQAMLNDPLPDDFSQGVNQIFLLLHKTKVSGKSPEQN